jgi:hypothetical protein
MFNLALQYIAACYLILSPLLIVGFIVYRRRLTKRPGYIMENYEGDVLETTIVSLLLILLSMVALSFILTA